MKKVLLTAAAVAFAASVMAATSQNVVGYYKVPKPADDLELAGMNLVTGDLNDVLPVGNFVGNYYSFNADSLLLWDAGIQNYVGYALYDGTAYYPADPIEWRPTANFYAPAPAIPLTPGSAIWIQSKASSTSAQAMFLGEAVADANATINITNDLNMVAFPFSCTVDLNDTDLKNLGTGNYYSFNADSILVWDTSIQNYVGYALYDGTAYYPADPIEWRPTSDFYSPAPPIDIDLGKGFWYDAKAAFTWTESNPYVDNL